MGQLLGCGAHLESLRRTAVAEFDISQAHTLEEINLHCHSDPNTSCHSDRSFPFPQGKGSGVEEPAFPDIITSLFIHPRQLLPGFPCVSADESTVARIRSGRPVNLPEVSRARHVKVFQGQSDLIAIASRVAGTLFHPKIVLVNEQAVAVAKGK
jgi:tRNA pseudouridine55 synthase